MVTQEEVAKELTLGNFTGWLEERVAAGDTTYNYNRNTDCPVARYMNTKFPELKWLAKPDKVEGYQDAIEGNTAIIVPLPINIDRAVLDAAPLTYEGALRTARELVAVELAR